MALAHFRMLIHEFFNKNPNKVPEKSPLIVLDSKYNMCMAKNGKDNKHTWIFLVLVGKIVQTLEEL